MDETYSQLVAFQQQIQAKIDGKNAVDIGYWGVLLQQLKAHMAQERLRDQHQAMLCKKLFQLKVEEASSSSAAVTAADNLLFLISLSDDATQCSGEDATVDSERPGTSAAMSEGNNEGVKPRKPHFFYHVHTSFEWNRYNKTHDDTDNPPPKLVQGYEFNIFYHDLIDKKTTLQFFLDLDPSPDFAVLRFHAGPPYEDIGF